MEPHVMYDSPPHVHGMHHGHHPDVYQGMYEQQNHFVPPPHGPPPPYGLPPPPYSSQIFTTEGTKHVRPAAIPSRSNISDVNSVTVQCINCGHVVVTEVEYEVGLRAHIFACLLCASLCLMPLFWLPYYVEKCRDTKHYCPVCGLYLGTLE